MVEQSGQPIHIIGGLPHQRDEILVYGKLMSEAKARLDQIRRRLHWSSAMPGALVRELCYLQLRMLCETIALSCLVAHGDILDTRSTKFSKQYRADVLIKELQKLHCNFFPMPVKRFDNPDGSIVLSKIEEGPLDRDLLVKLYHRCGALLHRGTYKTIDNFYRPFEEDLAEIENWAKMIGALLSFHVIHFSNTKATLTCMLCAGEDGGLYVQIIPHD